MSRGIRKAPMAGKPPGSRCKTPNPRRPTANRAPSIQRLSNRVPEREHALFDGGRHFADIADRFAPIVENARAPFDLRGERADLGLIRLRLVLQLAQCGDV